MKDYVTAFFRQAGCGIREEGVILHVDLSADLSRYFDKPALRLVFRTEDVSDQTELVTPGSYLIHRLYDLLKQAGRKVSVTLPQREEHDLNVLPPALHPLNCTLGKHRVREIQRTETYLTFRLTYHSDEKVEEIVTVGVDAEGNLRMTPEFPYSPDALQDAVTSRFPFTRKEAKAIYDRCLQDVNVYAGQQAVAYQEQAAQHFHANLTRLEAFYHQMMDEIPALEKDRDALMRQLQDEYDLKTTDELHKYRMQVSIVPLCFCTITTPFRRHQYTLTLHPVTINIYHNLFSGAWVYPRCESCGAEMKQIGVCEAKGHPVCHNCLVQCHECGAYVCKDCGIEVCFECGEWVCRQCSQSCHICGERYCTRHLLGCVLCREHFCTQCADACEVCGKLVEKTHLTACEISHKLACPGCLGVCSCCRKQVCQTLLKSCAFCGQQACTDCTFQCAVCHETFCVHHISECEVTKKMVCARHSGTCKSCGRHVSIKSLRKCDVCGKTVCPLCSTRCARCQTVFCTKDAGDMMTCPECEKTYCALCYSTHICR